jgi:UDP-3-O-[3-hydroxymyristoyl] N-acetylglucosamine deacetylase
MTVGIKRQGYRYQRTIARPVETHGIGILTGTPVRLCFRPALPSTGVVFVRTDLRAAPKIPANLDQVTGTQRRTTLGRPPGQVGMVEHVLAALAGLRIDNCVVEINAPDPPGLDGSSRQFVSLLLQAGAVLHPARRMIWSVEEPVVVAQEGATLALHPTDGDQLRVSYLLDYGKWSPIGWQIHTQTITPEGFAGRLADCRTFILESEAAELRRQGLGKGITNSDLLVFGSKGPIDNRLRYANEPARHKILDLVGDLSLVGHDFVGHLVGYRSGHTLNIELGRILHRQLEEALANQLLAA